MIHDEFEYRRIVVRLTEHHLQLVDLRERLEQSEASEQQIEQTIERLKSSCEQLEDEIAAYESRTARTWVPAC